MEASSGPSWSVACRLLGQQNLQNDRQVYHGNRLLTGSTKQRYSATTSTSKRGSRSQTRPERISPPSSPRRRPGSARSESGRSTTSSHNGGGTASSPRGGKGAMKWKCTSLEAEKAVIIQQALGPEESLQRISGFDKIFREQVKDEVIFQRLEEPLLNDVWNGADSCAVTCGAIEPNTAGYIGLRRPLQYLFDRIDEATDTAATVLRFKVFLSILHVSSDQIVDALAPAPRRLQQSSDGHLNPAPSSVQIDSAEEGIDRLAGVDSPYQSNKRAVPVHQVFCLRLERWVRSRKRGLLTPDRHRNSLLSSHPLSSSEIPADSSEDWSVTTSNFRRVFLHILETTPDGKSSPGKPASDALGAHASAHSHRLHRDVAQTLTSFCRCLKEDGLSYRETKLTYVLKPVFTNATRCTLTAFVESPSDNYCRSAGPLRFAERALRSLHARQSAPRVEPIRHDLDTGIDHPDILLLEDDEDDNGLTLHYGGLPSSESMRSITTRRLRKGSQASVETKYERTSEFSRPGSSSSSTRAFESSRSRALDILHDLREDLDHAGLERHDANPEYILDVGNFKREATSWKDSPFQGARTPRSKASSAIRINDLDETDLQASREALRQQLARFQVEKEIISKVREPITVTNESNEAIGDMVQRLEDERRQALEKGRGLMQQIWQLEAEKSDALRKARVLHERVEILEAERDAQEATLPQWRTQHDAQVEALKDQHTTEMEQLRRDNDARMRKLRAEHLEQIGQVESSRTKLAEQERKKLQEQIEQIEQRHKDEIKALRDRAGEREATFKQRLKDAQSEGRKHIEQATLKEIERDRLVREGQEQLADAKAQHQNELDKLRADIEEERRDMEQFREEERDRAEQALHDVEMERKLRREREEAHREALFNAQRRITALQDDVSRLSKTTVPDISTHPAGTSIASGDPSAFSSSMKTALVARVQQSEELSRLRRTLREKESETESAYAKLSDLQLQNSALMEDSERLRGEVIRLREEIELMKSQVAARDNEIISLKTVSGELSSAHEEACHELEKSASQIDQLHKELASRRQVDAQLSRAERELNNLRENLEDSQSALHSQERRVAEAETRALDLSSTLRDVERRLEEAMQEREQAIEDATTLRNRLIGAQEALNDHSQALDEIQRLKERLRSVEMAARQGNEEDSMPAPPPRYAPPPSPMSTPQFRRRRAVPASPGTVRSRQTSYRASSLERSDEEVIERAARAAADQTVASISNVLNRSHRKSSLDESDDPIRGALAQTLRDKEDEVKELKRRIQALASTNITFV